MRCYHRYLTSFEFTVLFCHSTDFANFAPFHIFNQLVYLYTAPEECRFIQQPKSDLTDGVTPHAAAAIDQLKYTLRDTHVRTFHQSAHGTFAWRHTHLIQDRRPAPQSPPHQRGVNANAEHLLGEAKVQKLCRGASNPDPSEIRGCKRKNTTFT
jgi:hypothetical protein